MFISSYMKGHCSLRTLACTGLYEHKKHLREGEKIQITLSGELAVMILLALVIPLRWWA